MYKYLIVIVIVICMSTRSVFAQQEPFHTSFSAIDFIWNPAMTATDEFAEAGAAYRQQWAGFDQAPRTIFAYAEVPLVNYNMSIGGYLTKDEILPFSSFELGLSYAYKMKLGMTYQDELNLGLSTKFSQYKYEPGSIIATDIQDDLISNKENTKLIPDFNFGFFYTTNKNQFDSDEDAVFLGVSLSQFLLPNRYFNNRQVNYKKKLHANALLGYRFNQGNYFIESTLWVLFAQKNLYNYRLNLNMEYEDTFWGGFEFNTGQSIRIQGGAILQNGILNEGYLRIGAAIGFGIGQLARHQGLTYEFLLSYRFWM